MIQSQQNNLPYLTKKQIITEVKHIIPLNNPSTQVAQALWHLSKYSKMKIPQVKYIGKNGWILYTPSDDSERIFAHLREYTKELSKRIIN